MKVMGYDSRSFQFTRKYFVIWLLLLGFLLWVVVRYSQRNQKIVASENLRLSPQVGSLAGVATPQSTSAQKPVITSANDSTTANSSSREQSAPSASAPTDTNGVPEPVATSPLAQEAVKPSPADTVEESQKLIIQNKTIPDILPEDGAIHPEFDHTAPAPDGVK